MRVAPGLTVSIAPWRSNTITPAVRLSRIVCRLARAPSTWATLLCTSSRASESCSVISANERVRPPSSSRDANTAFELKSPRATCAHALGEQQQRLRQLVAERDRQQQRAEHGEHERQRQRADVHLAQARARERALLVLAVGVGDGERVGGQAGRDRLRDDQEALLLAEREVAARDDGDGAHARRGAGGRRVLVEALGLADDALRCAPGAASAARSARASGPELAAAGREQRLAGAADDRDLLAPRAARAAARARAARPTTRSRRGARPPAASWSPRSLTMVSIVPRPRFRPASSAPSTLTSNQLSIERETNW